MIYLDASALVKLVVEEPESAALLDALRDRGPYVTSVVGEVETVRACRRAGVSAEQVEAVLATVTPLGLEGEVRELAGSVGPATLRTLDAIHLATALAAADQVDEVISYDVRLAAAAAAAGLSVAAPG